ncbi:MAG: hypothetical protein OXU43_06585 [Gammaproteobacteria bacterium]|nr:hypothetical protein [Gammaproteobacteria bacterium]
MHPAVRIANVLVLAMFLAAGNWAILTGVALLLAMVRSRAVGRLWSWQPLWRTRWLFLAILLAHLWMYAPSSAPQGSWRPALDAALRNCLGLALLALAVDTLRQASSREELLAGLLWWLRPLRRAGVPGERLAARLWLTLECLPEEQQRLSRLLAGRRVPAPRPRAGPPAAAGARLLEEAMGVLMQRCAPSSQELPRRLRLPPDPGRPRPWEWLGVLSLFALLAALGHWA